MQTIEELVQAMSEVNAWLAEAAPPPFKAADREKAGMAALPGPKLKTRTGAMPPPIPKMSPKKAYAQAVVKKNADQKAAAKTGEVLVKTHKKAYVDITPKTHNTGHLGITRSWAGNSSNTAAKMVQRRADKGESLSISAGEIRDLIGEGGGSRLRKAGRQDALHGYKYDGIDSTRDSRKEFYDKADKNLHAKRVQHAARGVDVLARKSKEAAAMKGDK